MCLAGGDASDGLQDGSVLGSGGAFPFCFAAFSSFICKVKTFIDKNV